MTTRCQPSKPKHQTQPVLQTPDWKQTLAEIKPQVRTTVKVEVRRKVSLRADSFAYMVQFVKV